MLRLSPPSELQSKNVCSIRCLCFQGASYTGILIFNLSGGIHKEMRILQCGLQQSVSFSLYPNFTCSKSAIKTLERGVKYIQS